MNPPDANTSPTADLYERLPYPGDGVVRTTVGRILRRGLQRHVADLLRRDPLWIADIGCGTGEATAGLARMIPNARVVGVDINPASLEKARAVAAKAGIRAAFVRADISGALHTTLAEAGPPEGRFDVVTSMGVLHHLDDPAEGFASVRRILREDGLFLGAVYSRMGRWDDIAVRVLLDRAVPEAGALEERARALRLLRASSRQSVGRTLKTLRHRLRHGPPFSLLEAVRVYRARTMLVHVSDTFSNPREHLFDFGTLAALFERTGWEFVALAEKGGLPTTPEAHTRDPETQAFLRALPRDLFYDYLAYLYRAWMFTFFLKPRPDAG